MHRHFFSFVDIVAVMLCGVCVYVTFHMKNSRNCQVYKINFENNDFLFILIRRFGIWHIFKSSKAPCQPLQHSIETIFVIILALVQEF